MGNTEKNSKILKKKLMKLFGGFEKIIILNDIITAAFSLQELFLRHGIKKNAAHSHE